MLFFFASRRRHTRCALVTGVQTCALPICLKMFINIDAEPRIWNTSFTLRRVLELYRDELKDLPPDIDRMELNRIINDRLATDLPSHRLSYPPLCCVIANGDRQSYV